MNDNAPSVGAFCGRKEMTTDKIYTTLKQIRQHRPCGLERGSECGYDKLRKNLGKNYGDDTLWCMRTVDPKWYPLWRHFAVDCAEDVKHLMTDVRSLNALDVSRRHADGNATDEELDAARAAARAAASDVARAAQMQRLFAYCAEGKRVMK